MNGNKKWHNRRKNQLLVDQWNHKDKLLPNWQVQACTVIGKKNSGNFIIVVCTTEKCILIHAQQNGYSAHSLLRMCGDRPGLTLNSCPELIYTIYSALKNVHNGSKNKLSLACTLPYANNNDCILIQETYYTVMPKHGVPT